MDPNPKSATQTILPSKLFILIFIASKLLFGLDTVVISGAIDALVHLYHLSPRDKGWTVAIALIGTVVGALGAVSPPHRPHRGNPYVAIRPRPAAHFPLYV